MPTSEDIKEYFYASQIVIGALFFLSVFFIRGGFRDPPSQFNDRSDDSRTPDPFKYQSLPDERPRPEAKPEKAKVFQLTGIRIDGPAHEILGVSPAADEKSVQKAYRDLMKRYHPDLVGQPGSREWKDAQKIAEAINLAKEEMLRALKARRSS